MTAVKAMSNCQKLWSIWFVTYLIVINTYLTVVSIKDYLDFKYQILDLAYGGNWDLSSIYVILCCLNISLGLIPIVIYMSVVSQGNLANDGHVLGRDQDVFHVSVNERGEGNIIPTINNDTTFCKNSLIRLIFMELPPLSYFLQVISAICFLIPRSIIEGHRIQHGVLKSNHIWHSDLDFIFDPDQKHTDFVYDQRDNFIQPLSVAYFNLGLSLVLMSMQYSRVLWHISRKFTILLSFTMIVWSLHFLIEYCSITVMVKISLNPLMVSEPLQISQHPFTILFLSISSNIVLLLSFTAVFHYGLLQYADTMFHRTRKCRQIRNSSPQAMIGSNHLDLPGVFSPSVSENNFSESSLEPLFSKTHMPHIMAIIGLLTSTSLKFSNIYSSFIHLYQTTADFLTLLNMLISFLFAILWLIIWFAFALRRTWNFRIKSDVKYTAEPLFLNDNRAPNHSGTMQLHQVHNSLLRNTKSSDMNLSKHDMMTMNRNTALDGGSDDTDMSSKLSSNNYVFLQSMRNIQNGMVDANGQPLMVRNPLYLSYAVNNQSLQNSGMLYANDNSTMNNRSVQIDDQLGSEHSYNSNRSRNLGLDNLPPILPNFDENRYRSLNSNSVALEKLIPRYLRNPSLDYNGSVHFSVPVTSHNNDYIIPTVTTPTMAYNHDPNISRYKQTQDNIHSRPASKFSTFQSTVTAGANNKPLSDTMEYLNSVHHNGDSSLLVRRGGPMFPVVHEVAPDVAVHASESLLPSYNGQCNGNSGDGSAGVSHNNQSNEADNSNGVTAADRMCSQV